MKPTEKVMDLLSALQKIQDDDMIAICHIEDYLVVRKKNIVSIESTNFGLRIVHQEMNKIKETILGRKNENK